MIPISDLLVILVVSIACAVIVGAFGLLALRLSRRAPIFIQLWIVVVSTVLSGIAGMIAAAQAMYVSPHDLQVMFYIAGTSGVVSLGIALVLGRTFTRSARRLQAITRAIGDGDSAATQPWTHANTEFEGLASELASTSQRLAESRQQVEALDASRREFFAWISHDLRTPLAGLRAMTEALADQLAADPRRFHRQMLSQIDQVSAMVDDLFELSKIQSGTLTLTIEPVSVYDLVSDSVAELGVLARSRSVTITESGQGDFVVAGDPRELCRMIGNLLLNAIQHSPAGSEISVATHRAANGDIVITVEDAGGGIAEHDLSQVFHAGWRATPSRTPAQAGNATGGAGLGLAIVWGIVQAHSGGVTVRNIPGGCRFDVSLPPHQPVAA